MSRFPRGRQLLCAIPFALQACGGGGSTGPAPKPARLSNPDSTAAQLQSLTAPFETDAFLNFAALHQHFGPAGSALAATLSPIRAPAVTPSLAPGLMLTDATTRVWWRAPATSPVAAAIFRDTVRGKTFVWDTTAARYVTSTAAGAPANGVRFVLYTTQPPISEPSRPLTAMGYADLTDQSTSSAAVLGVAVLGGTGPTPVTYVSYTVARSAAPAPAWAVVGFVTDGATLLDLTSAVTATSTLLTVQTAVDDATDGTHVSETGTLSRTWKNSADFSLTSGAETVRATGGVQLDTTGHTWGSGSVAVTVNGQAFATITIAPAGPSYSGASGVELTSADEAALARLLIAWFNVFGAVTVLTDPAWVLRM